MTTQGTPDIEEVFKTLYAHKPEWEQGFLQHTLLVALHEPDLIMNTAIGEALVLLPAHLRGTPYDASEDVQSCITRLQAVAERDPRFLKNFMDGKPCAPFL